MKTNVSYPDGGHCHKHKHSRKLDLLDFENYKKVKKYPFALNLTLRHKNNYSMYAHNRKSILAKWGKFKENVS